MIKTNKLPNTYQEVEYIESTGTQYIDTGYLPNANTIWKLKCYIPGSPTYYEIRCGRWGANNDRFSIYTTPETTGTIEVAIGGYYQQTNTDMANKILNITADATTLTGSCPEVNYSHTYTTQPPFTNQNTLYLFGRNAVGSGNTSPDGMNPMRIYSHRIWENGALVQNFVPCYRKSDNIIGLYDTVTGTFFTNAGTGIFLKGNDVGQHTIKKLKIKVNNTRLPDTYQEVKYIGSTGGQYIDTGYTPVPGDSIEVRNVNYDVGALYYAGTDPQIGILQLASTASRFATYFKYCRTSAAQEIPRLENGPYKIKQKGNGDLFINDKFVSNNSPASTGPNTQLFIGRRPNNENQYFVGYYGEVIVTNSSNVVVRDLIPCYRKSDNVIGMYDLANNVFYTNSGSGSFTKGPNISSQVDIKYIKTKYNNTMVEIFNDNFNNYQEVEYLSFNGHQAIRPLSVFTPTFGKFYMKIYQPQSSNRQFLIFGYATFDNAEGFPSKQDANLFTTNSNLSWKYRGNSTITNPINNSNILEITLDNTNKKMTINGTDYAFPSSYNNTCAYTRETFTVGGEVYEDRYMFIGRMYNFKYYDDGGNNLLVDLVPCYRKSDNKPGMYDKVHNTFYTNVGTGDFTVGPDV